MRIVTRYVVREHIGPLVFALTALTSLLMLQYVARQLANLAGKGLPWSAIGKFFVLSLPFTVAMTMPMAVLVATLYAFGRMASEHEITAFKASGVRVWSIMAPVLVAALALSIGMVLFNDQVLSRANHSLRVLQSDIARTKPALGLKDQVLNSVTEQFVMKVARSDAGTGMIWDVVIYDLSKPLERKTIYADSGRISLAPNERDLQLELFDGHVQELVKGDPAQLQRTFFRVQNVRVRGISQTFEASGTDTYKGDREMSVCELHERYIGTGREFRRLREEYLEFANEPAVAHQVLRNPRGRPPTQALATAYCRALASVSGMLQRTNGDSAATAGTPVQQPTGAVASPREPMIASVLPVLMLPQDTTRQDTVLQQVVPVPPPVQQYQPPAVQSTVGTPPRDSVFITGAFMSTTQQLVDARMMMDQLAVEIHKKFALSFACLVFVLFGPPIALRFPRGGVGVTIGVSIFVFGLYYVCLMGGETLADHGRLPPFIAMWMANIIFGVAGIVLLIRTDRATDASRGGGLREWWADRRAMRALKKAERAAQRRGAHAPAAGAEA